MPIYATGGVAEADVTAAVDAAVAAVVASAPATLNTLDELAAALGDDPNVLATLVLKSLFDANTLLIADTDNTPAALTVAASRVLGRKASGGIAAMTGTETGVVLSPAWTTYTPSWTSTGTAPAIVNGTITGAYLIIGKTYIFRIELTAGASTTFGTGQYSFSLGGGVTSVAAAGQACAVVLLDSSATLRAHATGMVAAGGTTVSRIAVNNSAGISNTIPWTWASGDVITITGAIEIA